MFRPATTSTSTPKTTTSPAWSWRTSWFWSRRRKRLPEAQRRSRATTSFGFRPRRRPSSPTSARRRSTGSSSGRPTSRSPRARRSRQARTCSEGASLQHPTRTLVSLDAGIDESAVRAALPATTDIQIVGIVRGVDESWTTLHETPTDLLVIACSGYSERALFLITSVVKERPGMPVVVLAHEAPEGFLRRVFEVGADDAVRLPESPEQVNFMIQKVLVRKRAAGTLRENGTAPMICVLGPKGGTGKTVTSSNLAVALAQSGRSVAAVDLDLQFG